MSRRTDGLKPAQPPSQTAHELIARLDALADPAHAVQLQRFFKTGPGEYGEGDVFAGLRMPQIRAIVKEFRGLPPAEVERVLASETHEHRMAALLVLVEQAKSAKRRGAAGELRRLSDFYLAHSDRVNNWDLVDVTCRDVVGEHLLVAGDIRPLKQLAGSDSLWERRIAMISTAAFMRAGRTDVTVELAELLIDDDHDLMHKAVGWMLREVGKLEIGTLEAFLMRHAATMPRTTLRYAIERMSAAQRADWMGRRAAAMS